MGDYVLNASKDIGMGVVDLVSTCGSEPGLIEYVLRWLAQIILVRVHDAGSGVDESSGVCCVGENTRVLL